MEDQKPESGSQEELSGSQFLTELLGIYKDYVDRVIAIDSKFVYLAGGSIALLVTFLSTAGDTQQLAEPILFMGAILFWLTAMVAILLAHWEISEAVSGISFEMLEQKNKWPEIEFKNDKLDKTEEQAKRWRVFGYICLGLGYVSALAFVCINLLF